MCSILNFKRRLIIPKRKTAWVNLSLEEIVRKYNYLWRGILNYYSFAYNRSQLNLIQYIIQHSAACTIMNKMRLNSRAQVFKKFGEKLCIHVEESFNKKVELKLEKNLSRISKFQVKDNSTLPFQIFNFNLRTNLVLNRECTICKSTENVEIHHRRPLKSKSTDNTLKGIQVNLSRRQIPLCRECHMMVHQGKYDGPGIY
jgi:hypothetical protein